MSNLAFRFQNIYPHNFLYFQILTLHISLFIYRINYFSGFFQDIFNRCGDTLSHQTHSSVPPHSSEVFAHDNSRLLHCLSLNGGPSRTNASNTFHLTVTILVSSPQVAESVQFNQFRFFYFHHCCVNMFLLFFYSYSIAACLFVKYATAIIDQKKKVIGRIVHLLASKTTVCRVLFFLLLVPALLNSSPLVSHSR